MLQDVIIGLLRDQMFKLGLYAGKLQAFFRAVAVHDKDHQHAGQESQTDIGQHGQAYFAELGINKDIAKSNKGQKTDGRKNQQRGRNALLGQAHAPGGTQQEKRDEKIEHLAG